MDAAVFHISRFLEAVNASPAAFSFVVCFTLPHQGSILHLVLIFVSHERPMKLSDLDAAATPFDRCMARYASLLRKTASSFSSSAIELCQLTNCWGSFCPQNL
jgi:hypothetical protein